MKNNPSFFFIILLSFSFLLNAQVQVTPVLGPQKYAVIPFDYAKDGLEVPVSEIEEGIFTETYSIKAFFEEVSYGKMTIEGTVYPYRNTQPPLYGTGYTDCYPMDEVIFGQADVDYSNIDGVISFIHDVSGKSCSFGNSTFGKISYTTPQGSFSLTRGNFRTTFEIPSGFHMTTNATIAHELMHGFGNGFHSNSYIKKDGEWAIQAYGNLFDILGLRQYASHPCSMVKHKMGWLTSNEIEYVTETATFRIYPLEKTLPGQTQSVIIELPNVIDFQPTDAITFDRLYLEYRGLTGVDTRSSAFRRVFLKDGTYYTIPDHHGLSVIGVDCTGEDCFPVLIDMHAEPAGGVGANYAPHEIADAPLNKGEIYTVPNNNITIEVIDVSPENYIDIKITMPSLGINTNKITIQKANEVYISPNPVNDFTQIKLVNGNLKSNQLKIYSLSGQLIKSFSVDSSKEQWNIDMRGIASGIYVLKLNIDNKVFYKKIVKN